MQNERIRREAKAAGVFLWEIAQEIGISEPTLTRWLRAPLPAEKATAIREAIKKREKAVM